MLARVRIALLVFVVSLLAGCASAPPLNFSVHDIKFTQQKIDAELKNVSASIAPEEEKTGELQVGFFGNDYEQSFKYTFKEALQEALTASGVFSPESKVKVAVFAKIYKLESPLFSVNFPTDMDVKYIVRDMTTGKIIFEKMISSKGEVPGDYAFMGPIRFTEARNRCVQNNIRMFIDDLSAIAKLGSLENAKGQFSETGSELKKIN